MGNPKFAINPLKSLLASNHDIVAVISNPPKPMGRKKILQHTDVGKYAIENNLNLIELEAVSYTHLTLPTNSRV